MEFFTSFACKNGEEVNVCKFAKNDFDIIWNFYEKEIAMLENKADFYPYKESEIKSILAGGGVFIGGFMGEKLVSLCAIDFDEEYQVGIKKANENFPNFPFCDGLLEFSGLFVAKEKRGLGMSEKMTDILIEIKRDTKPNNRLFAVVLQSNIPSMKNFFAHGFKLFGWWQMDSEFVFVYLISPNGEEIEKEKSESEIIPFEELSNKLRCGYIVESVKRNGDFIGYKKLV